MTTKARHPYTIVTDIDYASLEFNPDAPEPLPDGMFQYPVFAEVLAVLDAHLNTLGEPESIFRSSNTFICYDRANLNVRVGPDFYVAFDVEAPAIMERLIYLPWEAGKPPDFVLEIASESTGNQDTGNKRDIYARIGVGEYWRFDSTGGDFYGEPLMGEELVNGEYRPMELTTAADGVLKGYSPALRLWLCWHEGMLKFYDDRTASYLMNLPDTQAALDNTQAALGEAQARIRQLEENLRRAQGENS